MITTYPADSRGRTHTGWLDSRHVFSFGHYYDPQRMGFGPLRVINEDRVAAGAGFPTHAHANMEILTWVIGGALEHRDSLGNGSTIRAGDLQRLSAGCGVEHSEFNASTESSVHFLQIWIQPNRVNARPSYAQRSFSEAERRGRLRVLASHDGRDGSLSLMQDANLYGAVLAPGEQVAQSFAPGRHAWLQVVRGRVTLGEFVLVAGDGAAITSVTCVAVATTEAAEILLFDVAD